MSESGQSDRIPPVVCCDGCSCDVAHGDWQVDYGELTHLRLQARRLLDRVHRLEAATPPEPPVNVERLQAAVDRVVGGGEIRLPSGRTAAFVQLVVNAYGGAVTDAGTHLRTFGCNVFHKEGWCRWQGPEFRGGAAPDRLPSRRALADAIFESGVRQTMSQSEQAADNILAEMRLASLHEGTARPDDEG